MFPLQRLKDHVQQLIKIEIEEAITELENGRHYRSIYHMTQAACYINILLVIKIMEDTVPKDT